MGLSVYRSVADWQENTDAAASRLLQKRFCDITKISSFQILWFLDIMSQYT
jgi:hypothetical protein